MSGAKDKADARILTERIEHWPSMAGWWRVAPVQKIACPGGEGGHLIADGQLVYLTGDRGEAFCEAHLPEGNVTGSVGPTRPSMTVEASVDLFEREIIARERLAAAVERFANSFESLVNPVVRYIKHITRQQ